MPVMHINFITKIMLITVAFVFMKEVDKLQCKYFHLEINICKYIVQAVLSAKGEVNKSQNILIM